MVDAMKSTSSDMAYLKAWLLTEFEESEKGFFQNWSLIERANDTGNLITLKEGLIISFCVYFLSSIQVTIDIFSIKPDLRGCGKGRHLFLECEQTFRNLGARNIKLEVPAMTFEAASFWEKQGFRLSKEPHKSGFPRQYSKSLLNQS